MIKISLPNLSRVRHTSDSNSAGQLHEYKSGDRKTVIHKTVQYWFNGMPFKFLQIQYSDMVLEKLETIKDILCQVVLFTSSVKNSCKMSLVALVNAVVEYAKSSSNAFIAQEID